MFHGRKQQKTFNAVHPTFVNSINSTTFSPVFVNHCARLHTIPHLTFRGSGKLAKPFRRCILCWCKRAPPKPHLASCVVGDRTGRCLLQYSCTKNNASMKAQCTSIATSAHLDRNIYCLAGSARRPISRIFSSSALANIGSGSG